MGSPFWGDADGDETAVQGVYGVLSEFFKLFGRRESSNAIRARLRPHQAIARGCEALRARRASRRSSHGVHSSSAGKPLAAMSLRTAARGCPMGRVS